MTKPTAKWVKPLCDFGPLLAFFAAYLLLGLFQATAVLIGTTVLALLLSYLIERRIPIMPLVTAVIVGIFGGLTLWLQDETFLKMKPAIVQAIFSLVLLGGLAVNKPLLKPLLGTAWQMDDVGWRKLTLRFALFFAAMAVLNEAVWRTQSTSFWVTFKVFGIMGLTLVFALSQAQLMQLHAVEGEGSLGEDEADQ
jgi:intracellular septation protein